MNSPTYSSAKQPPSKLSKKRAARARRTSGPITIDVGGERMHFPNEHAMAVWLAAQHRVQYHKTEALMPVNLSDIVKAHGVVALCKYMVEQNSSFGATEADLVALATADAHRRNPTDTPSGAFAKLYMESAVLRDAIEIARAAVFANAMAAEIEKDARKACDELAAIGKQRWPSMSPAQRFARAFETNPELAARAHRRPGPSTSFPFAKASSLAAPVVDPKPTIADAQNIDDPQEAIRQLAAAGARKNRSYGNSNSR